MYIVLVVRRTSYNNRTPARAGGKVVGVVLYLVTSSKECFLARIVQILLVAQPNSARRVEVSLLLAGFGSAGRYTNHIHNLLYVTKRQKESIINGLLWSWQDEIKIYNPCII